jgi:hypothetical protein
MNLRTLVLVAANLVPLLGVIYWGWDAFVLLILYWLETAIIAFWTIVRLVLADPTEIGDVRAERQTPSSLRGRLFLAAFFTFHAGIFMLVHFVFLWTLFAGQWADVVHGPVSFVRELIVGTDLWIPLLVLFFVRGWSVLGPMVRDGLGLEAAEQPKVSQSIIGGLYTRIIVMQFTIILGGFIANALGSVGALILLILGKTALDVFYDRMGGYLIEEVGAKADGEADTKD